MVFKTGISFIGGADFQVNHFQVKLQGQLAAKLYPRAQCYCSVWSWGLVTRWPERLLSLSSQKLPDAFRKVSNIESSKGTNYKRRGILNRPISGAPKNGVVSLKFFLPNPTEPWGKRVRQGLAIADPVPQTSNGRFKRRWCWGETLAAVILLPYFIFPLVPGAAASCLRNMCRETWRWFFRGGLFFDDLGYELGLIQHSS